MSSGVLDRPVAATPDVQRPAGHPRPRNRHWSGLDGLRALAVVAVVLFHFAPSVLPGGFLGVDVFFVLSGYLITRLLAEEFLRARRFRFRRFYSRRARRLLPAVAGLLLAVLAAAAFWRDQLATVRPATLAAASYVSNWWQVLDHQSYFVSTGRPSMLQHLWSLGVEEQFYLLWPVLAIGVLRLRGGAEHPLRSARRLALVAGLLALASTVWMAVLAVAHNVPYGSDGSRLYYGADTHGMGLLLGSALGALASGQVLGRRNRLQGRGLWFTDVMAMCALAALVWFIVITDQYDVWLYRGGYLAVAAVTGCCVLTVTRVGSRVGQAMEARPIRWLAQRSYAIYLWHWPIAVVSRPGIDVHAPVLLVQAGRVLLTLALAELSYRLIEAPIRRVGFRIALGRAQRCLGRIVSGRAPVGARTAAAGVLATVLTALAVLVVAPAAPMPAAEQALGAGGGGRDLSLTPVRAAAAARTHRGGPPRSEGTAPGPQLSGPALVRSVTDPTARSAAGGPAPAARPPAPAADRPLPALSAFGDSVMLGARTALGRLFPHGSLDAVEGRQPGPILHDVQLRAADGTLAPLVVIGVGDNGLINPQDLRTTLAQLRGHRVIVINNRVAMPWEGPNNITIAKVCAGFGNVRLLDWHRLSAPHPGWFYEDGIHLRPEGATAYAALIAKLAR